MLTIDRISTPRTLVLVRAGPVWNEAQMLEFTSMSEFWDLAVSWYGPHAPLPNPAFSHVHHMPGGKWEGVFEFFRIWPEALDEYDYIWLPDDDIQTSPEDMGRLFGAMHENDLWLAQSALSDDSQIYWPITLHCPELTLRWTTFIELMAPCFSSRFLKTVLPLFEGRRTGYGLDHFWAYWTDIPSRRCAIVDASKMTHPRREQASGLYRTSEDVQQELKDFLEQYNKQVPQQLITGAIDADGAVLRPGKMLSIRIFRSLANSLLKNESAVRVGRFTRLFSQCASVCVASARTRDIGPLPLPESSGVRE